jgi:hypothetical protein
MGFVPDEALQAVLLGEARDDTLLVLPDPTIQAARRADVDRAQTPAGHDVDGDIALFPHEGRVVRETT